MYSSYSNIAFYRRNCCLSSRKSVSYTHLAESVLQIIEEFAGVLPFDDKASPEVIKREFGLSKNAFKRAVGHLLKEGKIEIRDRRIYQTKK